MADSKYGKEVGTVTRKVKGKIRTSKVYEDSKGRKTYVFQKDERVSDVERQKEAVKKVKAGESVSKRELRSLERAGLTTKTDKGVALTGETAKVGVKLKAQEQTQTKQITRFTGSTPRDYTGTYTVQTSTTPQFTGGKTQTTTIDLTRDQIMKQEPDLYSQFQRGTSKQVVTGTIKGSGSTVGIGSQGEKLTVVEKERKQREEPPQIFISEESFKKTPSTLARARGEQGVGITKSSYRGVAPKDGLVGTSYAPLSESEAKRITDQPFYKDPLVQAVGITGGVAVAGGLGTYAVATLPLKLTAETVATSIVLAKTLPKAGEQLSLLTTSKQDKQFIKSEKGQEAIAYGLYKSSEKIESQSSWSGVFTKLKESKFRLGSLKPGLAPGTISFQPRTNAEFEAQQELSGRFRAFAEDLTVLAGDKQAYLEGAREYAQYKGFDLTKGQEQALLKARIGRGTGQVIGAIGIGASSERLGQRYVSGVFAKHSASKLAAGEIGKFTAFKAGAAIIPAGVQEGASMYLLESETRGFQPTKSGLLKSAAIGGTFAGVAGGVIAGGAVAKKGFLKPIGKTADVVLNILDPYEKAGDITYDVASSAFSKTFRTPVFTPTVTQTEEGLFSLGKTKTQQKEFKVDPLIKTEAQTTLEKSLSPAKGKKRKKIFVDDSFTTGAKVPVETRTDSSLFTDSKTQINLKQESKAATKTDPFVNIEAQTQTKPFVSIQSQIKPLAQTQTKTQSMIKVEPLVQTQTQTQTQANIPVTTFDEAPPFPFIPFGGGRGKKGFKGKKPKVTGEAETLYRIFTGKAKAKKGLFGASSFNLRS